MGHITSPARIGSDALTLIDLQLFGVFDVKTDEAYANAEAQADDESAPEDEGDGAAQDEDQSLEPDNAGAAETDASDTEPAGEEQGDQPEAQAGETAPEGQSKLILGKFKSYEALEAAYEEAQRQLGRLHREIAEQRRKEQAAAQEQKPKEPETPPKSPEEIAAENRERLRRFIKDPIAYESELIRRAREEALSHLQQTESQRKVREQTVMDGIMQVAGKYGDFQDLEPTVRAALSERPSLRRAMTVLQSDPNATADDFAALVEDAYLWAKSQTAQAALQSAREQGRQEAAAALRQRTQANVAHQGTRRDQTQETAEDRIKREILTAGRPRGLWRN